MNRDCLTHGAAASLLAQGLRRIRTERKALARLQRQARPEPPPRAAPVETLTGVGDR